MSHESVILSASPVYYFTFDNSNFANLGSASPITVNNLGDVNFISASANSPNQGPDNTKYVNSVGTSGEGFIVEDGASIFNDNNFSISAWVRADSSTRSNPVRTIFGAKKGSGQVLIFLTDYGAVQFQVNDGGGTFRYVDGGSVGFTAMDDNRWHHILAVVENKVLKCYVDGVNRMTSTAYPGNVNIDGEDLHFLRFYGTPDSWRYQGDIAHIAVFNQAITDTTFIEEMFMSGLETWPYEVAVNILRPQFTLSGGYTDDSHPVPNSGSALTTLTSSGTYRATSGTDLISPPAGFEFDRSSYNGFVFTPQSETVFSKGSRWKHASAWVKVDNTFTDYATVFRNPGSGASTETHMRINGNNVSASGQVHVRYGNTTLTSGVSVADNEWHHVMMTVGAGNLRIFVDGSQAAIATSISELALSPETTSPLYIGTGPSSSPDDRFIGLLDEVSLGWADLTWNAESTEAPRWPPRLYRVGAYQYDNLPGGGEIDVQIDPGLPKTASAFMASATASAYKNVNFTNDIFAASALFAPAVSSAQFNLSNSASPFEASAEFATASWIAGTGFEVTSDPFSASANMATASFVAIQNINFTNDIFAASAMFPMGLILGTATEGALPFVASAMFASASWQAESNISVSASSWLADALFTTVSVTTNVNFVADPSLANCNFVDPVITATKTVSESWIAVTANAEFVNAIVVIDHLQITTPMTASAIFVEPDLSTGFTYISYNSKIIDKYGARVFITGDYPAITGKYLVGPKAGQTYSEDNDYAGLEISHLENFGTFTGSFTNSSSGVSPVMINTSYSYINSASFQTTLPPGFGAWRWDSAIQFYYSASATEAFIEWEDSAFNNSPMTYSAWFLSANPEAFPLWPLSNRTVLKIDGPMTPEVWIERDGVWVSSSALSTPRPPDLATTPKVGADPDWPSSTYTSYWTHIAVVLEGNKITTYWDGQFSSSATFPYTRLTGPSFKLGANLQGHPGGPGASRDIDDIAIFDRALTQAEIKDIFNGTPSWWTPFSDYARKGEPSPYDYPEVKDTLYTKYSIFPSKTLSVNVGFGTDAFATPFLASASTVGFTKFDLNYTASASTADAEFPDPIESVNSLQSVPMTAFAEMVTYEVDTETVFAALPFTAQAIFPIAIRVNSNWLLPQENAYVTKLREIGAEIGIVKSVSETFGWIDYNFNNTASVNFIFGIHNFNDGMGTALVPRVPQTSPTLTCNDSKVGGIFTGSAQFMNFYPTFDRYGVPSNPTQSQITGNEDWRYNEFTGPWYYTTTEDSYEMIFRTDDPNQILLSGQTTHTIEDERGTNTLEDDTRINTYIEYGLNAGRLYVKYYPNLDEEPIEIIGNRNIADNEDHHIVLQRTSASGLYRDSYVLNMNIGNANEWSLVGGVDRHAVVGPQTVEDKFYSDPFTGEIFHGFEIWVDGELDTRSASFNSTHIAPIVKSLGGRTFIYETQGSTGQVIRNRATTSGIVGVLTAFFARFNTETINALSSYYTDLADMPRFPQEAKTLRRAAIDPATIKILSQLALSDSNVQYAEQANADALFVDPVISTNVRKILRLYWDGPDAIGTNFGATTDGKEFVVDTYSVKYQLSNNPSDVYNVDQAYRNRSASATVAAQPSIIDNWRDINGVERLININNDIDLGDYEAIVFMDYPDNSDEIDSILPDKNYVYIQSEMEQFINRLKQAIVSGKSLYVSSPTLAVRLGIISKETIIEQSYDSNDFISASINPFITTASVYFDTHRNNKYKIANEFDGITNIAGHVLSDAISYRRNLNDEYHLKYISKPSGLSVNDTFFIAGLPLTPSQLNQDYAGYTNNRIVNLHVIDSSDILTGTAIAGLDGTNYITTIALKPGDSLSGSAITGKVFVNFVEDALTMGITEYNYATIQTGLTSRLPDEDNSTIQWNYSTSRTTRRLSAENNIIDSRGSDGQTSPTYGGGGPFVQAPTSSTFGNIRIEHDADNEAFTSSIYFDETSEIYPIETIFVPSMTWRGMNWLINIDNGEFIKPLPMSASTSMPYEINADWEIDNIINLVIPQNETINLNIMKEVY